MILNLTEKDLKNQKILDLSQKRLVDGAIIFTITFIDLFLLVS